MGKQPAVVRHTWTSRRSSWSLLWEGGHRAVITTNNRPPHPSIAAQASVYSAHTFSQTSNPLDHICFYIWNVNSSQLHSFSRHSSSPEVSSTEMLRSTRGMLHGHFLTYLFSSERRGLEKHKHVHTMTNKRLFLCFVTFHISEWFRINDSISNASSIYFWSSC